MSYFAFISIQIILRWFCRLVVQFVRSVQSFHYVVVLNFRVHKTIKVIAVTFHLYTENDMSFACTRLHNFLILLWIDGPMMTHWPPSSPPSLPPAATSAL